MQELGMHKIDRRQRACEVLFRHGVIYEHDDCREGVLPVIYEDERLREDRLWDQEMGSGDIGRLRPDKDTPRHFERIFGLFIRPDDSRRRRSNRPRRDEGIVAGQTHHYTRSPH